MATFNKETKNKASTLKIRNNVFPWLKRITKLVATWK